MGHLGFKTDYNGTKFTAEVFIQHHRAVQLHTAISRLTRAPLRPRTVHSDFHWACEKQPAKPDHSNLAGCDCESCLFM